MISPERYRRIDELFQAALEVEPDQRAAFLSSSCGEDESLREEVEALIAASGQELSLIDKPVPEITALVLPKHEPELSVGSHLGHYRILSLLGTGGMGQVYLAEDSRLGRKVALKLLPAQFTTNEQRLRRFQIEARAASALNHPNILTIYDIAEVDEKQLIATEFVDGETLRHRIKQNQLGTENALDVAIQVASALTAAHQAGIVHRDIKPENIMLRRDGLVKVLDFGLAKLVEGNGAAADIETRAESPFDGAESLERVKPGASTDAGLLMGTLPYMSPEQASGLDVDARSDIFSLGVLIYEMATGRVPFEGEPSSVIAAILKEEPPSITQSSPDAPSELSRVVSKALRKEKTERYQTVEELLRDLKSLKETMDLESKLSRSPKPGGRVNSFGRGPLINGSAAATARLKKLIGEFKQHKTRSALAIVVVVLVVVAVSVGLNRMLKLRGIGIPFQNIKVTRFTTTGDARNPSISPDGKYVIYAKGPVASGSGKFSIWLREVGTADETQIVPPTEGSLSATTFSPDGKYISYRTNAPPAFFTMPIMGGEATRLPLKGNGNFLFSPDGKRLAYLDNRFAEGKTVLVVANADGTDERDIITRQAPNYYRTAIRPAWSPDGKLIACVGQNGDEGFVRVFEVSVDARTERPITTQRWNDILSIRWLPDASALLLAASEETSSSVQIWCISYPRGGARRITNDTINYFDLDLTANGNALVTTEVEAPRSIWVMKAEVKPPIDASDSAISIDSTRASQINTTNFTGTSLAEGFARLRWAPNGRIVYVSQESGNTDIWSMNADGSDRRQLTTDPHWDTGPDVSPDGRYIVFMSNRSGNESIWRMDIDGRNQTQLTSKLIERDPHFSADGKSVYFTCWETGRLSQCQIPVEGGQTTQVTPELAEGLTMSPDGKLLLYTASGKVLIAPSEGGPPIKAFDLLGYAYEWAPDGKAVTFLPTTAMNRTAMATRPGFNRLSNVWMQPLDGGEPRLLTNFSAPTVRMYAWSRNGKKLAVVRGNNTSDVVLITDVK